MICAGKCGKMRTRQTPRTPPADALMSAGNHEGTPMNVGGKPYRTIWLNEDGWSVEIIDQTRLPHRFKTRTLHDLTDAAHAIRSMQVRGAPLIGVTAAYGLCLALREDSSDSGIDRACETLMATRPTAVNLRWAVEEMRTILRNQPKDKDRKS